MGQSCWDNLEQDPPSPLLELLRFWPWIRLRSRISILFGTCGNSDCRSGSRKKWIRNSYRGVVIPSPDPDPELNSKPFGDSDSGSGSREKWNRNTSNLYVLLLPILLLLVRQPLVEYPLLDLLQLVAGKVAEGLLDQLLLVLQPPRVHHVALCHFVIRVYCNSLLQQRFSHI